MSKENMPDVLVLGAGPAGMAIASALGKEKLDVEVLSPNGPDEPCLLYTSPSPRDVCSSRMPSSA